MIAGTSIDELTAVFLLGAAAAWLVLAVLHRRSLARAQAQHDADVCALADNHQVKITAALAAQRAAWVRATLADAARDAAYDRHVTQALDQARALPLGEQVETWLRGGRG